MTCIVFLLDQAWSHDDDKGPSPRGLVKASKGIDTLI